MTLLRHPFDMGVLVPQRFSNLLTLANNEKFQRAKGAGNRIYAAGTTDNGGTLLPFVCLFDHAGTLQWAIRIDVGAAVDSDIAMDVTPDGECFILCATGNTHEIYKIDATGAIAWNKTYDLGEATFIANMNEVLSDGSGDCIAALRTSADDVDTKLVKLDGSDGSETWAKNISHTGHVHTDIRGLGWGVVSGLIICTGNRGNAAVALDPIMTLVNSDGSISSGVEFSVGLNLFAGEQGLDGNYYVIDDTGSTLNLHKLNSSLALQWSRSYPIGNPRLMTVVGEEDGIIVIGNDSTDGYMVSVDSSGTEIDQFNLVGGDTKNSVFEFRGTQIIIATSTGSDGAYVGRFKSDLSDLLDGNGITYTDASLTQTTPSVTVATPTPVSADYTSTVTTPARTRTVLSPTENHLT